MIKSGILTLVLAAAAMIAAAPAGAGVGLAVGVTSNPGDGILPVEMDAPSSSRGC